MNKDLEVIKKKYGEKMAHLCRELFPTILETEGKLPEVLQSNFAVSKNLYYDIKAKRYERDFQNYLLNRYDNTNIRKIEVEETPEELMKKAGYKLYACNTQEQIDYFQKYYEESEMLCTFSDTRLDRCHVFFAVKNNVDEIKREDFPNPERQDDYGTSVISIQFSKGDNNITSIKNRYNTAVDNPDATFSNNLENIITGLTSSFEKHYNLDINYSPTYFNLPNYTKANDKRLYKYYHKIDNVYYCENNLIIDNNHVIRDFQIPERYIVMDNYILDLTKKEVRLYDESKTDGFIENLQNISKIYVKKDKETGNKIIKITKDNSQEVDLVINKNNNIIEYKDENLIDAGKDFLRYSTNLEKLTIPNLRRADTGLLEHNKKLKEFSQPYLEKIPSKTLSYNEILNKVSINNVKEIGNDFLNENRNLKEISLNNVEKIGDGFLEWNRSLQNINLNNIKEIGECFLNSVEYITINNTNSLELKKLEKVGNNFLTNNKNIKDLKLNNLKTTGHGFISSNEQISHVEANKLEEVGDAFLSNNKYLEKLSLPNLVNIKDEFLSQNNILTNLQINNVEHIGNRFLKSNQNLENLNISKVNVLGEQFMPNNVKVKIQAPNLNLKDKIYNTQIRRMKKRVDQIKNGLSIHNISLFVKKMELIRNHNISYMNNSNIDKKVAINGTDTVKTLVNEVNNKNNIQNNEKRKL